MSRKKKYRSVAKQGTWFTLELLSSKAYYCLSSNAKFVLAQFYLCRNFNKNYSCVNKNDIYLTYKKLENIFVRKPVAGIEIPHTGKRGMGTKSIYNAITDLLAKGFIKIVRQGGMCEKDKTTYALTDEWKTWDFGDIVRTRETRGRQIGWCRKNKL